MQIFAGKKWVFFWKNKLCKLCLYFFSDTDEEKTYTGINMVKQHPLPCSESS